MGEDLSKEANKTEELEKEIEQRDNQIKKV